MDDMFVRVLHPNVFVYIRYIYIGGEHTYVTHAHPTFLAGISSKLQNVQGGASPLDTSSKSIKRAPPLDQSQKSISENWGLAGKNVVTNWWR